MMEGLRRAELLAANLGRQFLRVILTSQTERLTGLNRWLQWGWMLALYVIGMLVWGFFLGWGEIPFEAHDWNQEWGFYTILQEAIRSGRLPLHTSPAAYATRRFLAIPQTSLSPQILLLSFMGIGRFILVNTWLHFTLGFVGCLLLGRSYRLSPLVFGFTVMLFSLNGHITAQIAVGHSMWVGYYFLPFFFLLLLKLREDKPRSTWHLWMGLILFGILLQGSIHIFAWCIFYLALVWLVAGSGRLPITKAVVLAVWLGAFRVIPAGLEFWEASARSFPGFPSFAHLLSGLVTLGLPSDPVQGALSRWEYDMYLGVVGFLLLLYFGLYLYVRDQSPADQLKANFFVYFFPASVFSVLSLGSIYTLVRQIPLPLISHERVPSRFLIMTAVTLIVLASLKGQEWLSSRERSAPEGLAYLALFLILVHDLVQHARIWRVELIKDIFPATPLATDLQIVREADPSYLFTLGIAASLSGIALMYVAQQILARRKVNPRA